jgi:nuclear transcription factor Y gamma
MSAAPQTPAAAESKAVGASPTLGAVATGARFPSAAAPKPASAPASKPPVTMQSLVPPQPSPTKDSPTYQQINQRLDAMWAEQKAEAQALTPENKASFKHQNDLPLARIKRVMKSDEDVRMISAEAPILFAKACEMFVLDLTIRCWAFSEHNKRGGLENEDVLQVLKETDIFDFLAQVMALPRTAPRD